MLAPTKRRHVSFYLSLPLVVAIALLLVARLAALQRADIVAELADRVTHQDAPEAAAAVRQLAAIPRPPVAILVVAATSADRQVADEAQQAISKLLRRSQRQIEAKRGFGAVALQLAELAESLAQRRDMFLTGDHPWLAATARKIVRLANRIPPRHAPLVAMHCDVILTAIAPAGNSHTEIAGSDATRAEPFVGAGATTGDSGESRQARLQPEFSVVSAKPSERPAAREQAQVGAEPTESAPADTQSDRLMGEPWRASWSHPMFRMMPAIPINALPVNDNTRESPTLSPESESLPHNAEVTERPLADVGSRELLDSWLHADSTDVFPVEQELTRRGFGRLSERLAQQLFSKLSEDRLRLVDDVLTEPGVDARPWLVLLADDPDADVRLLAVTIMATSNDAALVEKAWQVAIQDRDQRIAGLAGRLRERRAGLQRR